MGHASTDIPTLIVPGIGDSGPGHWQTIWEAQHPHWRRVEQRDWHHPRCNEWVLALETAIAAWSAPPLLIAHSIGCLTVAHWAQHSSVGARAAFLVAIPDPQGLNFPPSAEGFEKLPLGRLPFPSLVIASADDPFGSVAHAQRCAAAWGSEFVDIGPAGHINAESGHGEWPQGFSLLERWMKNTMPPPR